MFLASAAVLAAPQTTTGRVWGTGAATAASEMTSSVPKASTPSNNASM